MSRFIRRCTCQRSGFTILELLVVIGVISLLLAILLPATASLSAAARKLQCSSKLRELGIAVHAYHERFQMLPSPNLPSGVGTSGDASARGTYSSFARILPDLEQSDLFEQINFVGYARSTLSFNVNHTVMTTPMAAFQCPSDSRRVPVAGVAPVNFRVNMGVTGHWAHMRDTRLAGPFMMMESVNLSFVADGTTRTAAISERIIGDWVDAVVSDGDYYAIDGYYRNVYPQYGEVEIEYCQQQSSQPLHIESRAGQTWFLGTLHDTVYKHMLPPNSARVDCSFGNSGDVGNSVGGILSVRSRHAGGANVLFLDGSVMFYSSSVDADVWRALGTRSGNEVR